jgi:hypothetical protein
MVPALYASTISATLSVRWSPSATLTMYESPAGAAALAEASAEPPVVDTTPALLTTMVAPQRLHLILAVLPWTFSSATVYFA